MSDGRVWTLARPAPQRWLNANDRTDRRAETAARRGWREAAHVWAIAAKLPKGLAKARVEAWLRFTDSRRRDPSNWAPTAKACIDGLIDYGFLPDDSAKYLIGPDMRLGEPVNGRVGQLVLVIIEVVEGP